MSTQAITIHNASTDGLVCPIIVRVAEVTTIRHGTNWTWSVPAMKEALGHTEHGIIDVGFPSFDHENRRRRVLSEPRRQNKARRLRSGDKFEVVELLFSVPLHLKRA